MSIVKLIMILTLIFIFNTFLFTVASDGRSSITGKIQVVISDNFEEKTSDTNYFLEDDNNKRFLLKFSNSKEPKLNTGTKVKVRGFINNNVIMVPSVSNYDFKILQDKKYVAGLATGTKKIAIILFNFQNDAREMYGQDYARDIFFNGDDSVKAYYNEISFGKLNLTGYSRSDGDIYGWYTINYDNNSEFCEYEKWGKAAEDAAMADGFNFSNYDGIFHVFPGAKACGWAGLAYINGSRAWVRGDWGTKGNVYVYGHELGHTFGMGHAASYICFDDGNNRTPISDKCIFNEYGDIFDIMGSWNTYHTNTYHKNQLGFYGTNNVKTIMKDGVYKIAPMEKYSVGIQALKIVRSDANIDTDIYYLEYRQPNGFDSFSSNDSAVNGILVRLGTLAGPSYWKTYLLDATPETADFKDASLGVGKTLKDDIAGITVTLVSISSENAQIYIDLKSDKCVRANPDIEIKYNDDFNGIGSAGDELKYSVIVSNNDSSECSFSDFNVVSELPDGWSQSPSSFELTLKAGESETTFIGVKSPTDLTDGGKYTFTETVSNDMVDYPFFSASAVGDYTVAVKPAIPRNFTATPGGCGTKEIVLNWDDSEDATEYNIFRHKGISHNASVIKVGDVNSYTDTRLGNNILYFYQMRACNSKYCSGYSRFINATSPLSCGTKQLTVKMTGKRKGKITGPKGFKCVKSYSKNRQCVKKYKESDSITFTAIPDVGFSFGGWEGECEEISDYSCVLTASRNKTVEGVFNKSD